MSEERLAELLSQVASGAITQRAALERLRRFPIEDLTFARVDHLRPLVQGFPEVVLCEGKTVAQILAICEVLVRSGGCFLATRAATPVREALSARFPRVEVNELARTVHLAPQPPRPPTGRGTVLIVTAGTGDLPVAEEAVAVARALGNHVETLYDVGVAGIHRVLQQTEMLDRATVIVVVAGMDGALASVVGGMVRVPVIAVPTSVGYGAAFHGIAPLLAMLNSCASGVTVVNIDNGFGAAAAASRINHLS